MMLGENTDMGITGGNRETTADTTLDESVADQSSKKDEVIKAKSSEELAIDEASQTRKTKKDAKKKAKDRIADEIMGIEGQDFIDYFFKMTNALMSAPYKYMRDVNRANRDLRDDIAENRLKNADLQALENRMNNRNAVKGFSNPEEKAGQLLSNNKDAGINPYPDKKDKESYGFDEKGVGKRKIDGQDIPALLVEIDGKKVILEGNARDAYLLGQMDFVRDEVKKARDRADSAHQIKAVHGITKSNKELIQDADEKKGKTADTLEEKKQ